MKITGIVIIILGIISAFGGIMSAIGGYEPNFTGLGLIVLGAFLINRANKKKKEEENKENWEKGNSDNL